MKEMADLNEWGVGVMRAKKSHSKKLASTKDAIGQFKFHMFKTHEVPGIGLNA
jgi:hypothetical protein